MPLLLQRLGEYRFSDTGTPSENPAVVLLHGLVGEPDGWFDTVEALTPYHRVLVPHLPLAWMPMQEAHVPGLVEFVHRFIVDLGLEKVILVGNSLGGQIALMYTLKYGNSVAGLVLLASSGIGELALGKSTFKRQDRDFIRKHAAKSFYDPVHVTDELTEFVHSLISDRKAAIRLIKVSRSSRQINVKNDLERISVPTMLIWGADDQITPPDLADTFNSLLPVSELHFIDKCGHAPMMEYPDITNRLLLDFLHRLVYEPSYSAVSA